MANNFKLTLDTLAPTGSITAPDEYVNAEAVLTINHGDDATHMKVWFDGEPEGNKADVADQDWEPVATSKTTAFTSAGDGNYFYHLLLKDDVANESAVFNTSSVTFDKTPPEIRSFRIMDVDSNSETLTNDRKIKYNLTCADNMAGVSKVYITGEYINSLELTDNIELKENVATGEIIIKSNAPSGTSISVNVKAVDYAGNESIITTKSIVLDIAVGIPTIVLTKDSAVIAENSYINYHDVTAEVTLNDTDIVGYKIWEITEPATYTEYTKQGEAFKVTSPVTLSANDGKKTVYAKLIDAAGTETDTISYTINIDTVDPVVSLSASKALISAVSGYNESVLTMSGTDTAAGIKSYTLTVGSTILDSGSNKVVPSSFTVAHTSLAKGDNTITLTVTDKAENVASTSVTIELDTDAPVFEVPTLNAWYNTTAGFTKTFTCNEKNAIAEVYAWTNTSTTDTVVPSTAVSIDAVAKTVTLTADNVIWNLAQTDANYLHVKVMDEVGNATYKHYKFGYDNIIPTGSIRFEKTVYGNTTAKAIITYSTEDVSGINKMKVTGDITNPSTDWEDIASSKSVTLSAGDGQKMIAVQFKDVAGNISGTIDSTNKAELDQSKPGVTLTLYKADGETPKPSHSSEAATVIHLAVTDDVLGIIGDSNVEYRVWGDFEGSDATKWEPLTMDAGKASKSIAVTITGAGEARIATKNFNAQIRDTAGNVSEIATASFEFDNTPPEVTVKDLDHNRISKVPAARFCTTTEHGTDVSYADEVKFKIEPNEIITEWKVCAYKDETAALNGKATDAAIGMTNKSENMSGTTNSSSVIACLLKGADYEAALGGAGNDGMHYVVVYVKNEAGLWSATYVKA